VLGSLEKMISEREREEKEKRSYPSADSSKEINSVVALG
jgi:hypothetical protein